MDKDKFDGGRFAWKDKPAAEPLEGTRIFVTDRNVQYVVGRGALFVDPEWARIMGREDLLEPQK